MKIHINAYAHTRQAILKVTTREDCTKFFTTNADIVLYQGNKVKTSGASAMDY